MGKHGGQAPIPPLWRENGRCAKAGGQRWGIAWDKRSRALDGHGARPHTPFTENGKWVARRGRRAATEHCIGQKVKGLGRHGAMPHTPLWREENGRRARAGGRRRDVAWGKRSRALGEHGYKAPYPLYREAGAFAYQNKNSFHLYMACKNAGPCQHLLFGKTIFGGAGGTDKFCLPLFRALRGKHKLGQHLPFGKTVFSGAGGMDKFRFPLFRALRGVHKLASICPLTKRFSAARVGLTNSAFLSSAHFAASTSCASICFLAKRFSAARAGLTNSAFPSFGCENRKSPQNRIKIPAMQILSARNGTGGFFT